MRKWMLGCLICWSLLVRAEDGVLPGEVRIGMANALTGPAAGLGLQLRAGATAYLDRINAAGGVHGRRLALLSVDDGYDPVRSAKATESLIRNDKVLALFGYVGTPTSQVAVPIATHERVPFLFPFTGADFLRTPVNPYVFNLRASYIDEAEALVARLTADGAAKIALVIQDDAFGAAGKVGVERALAKRKLKPLLEARFARNTVEVGAALEQLRQRQPDAVVFIGTYRPFAALLRRARQAGVAARFATVSFVGTSEFIKHAGNASEGALISQVMPDPNDASDPLVRQYHGDVPVGARNYGSLEGYAGAMLLVEALQRCGPQPSRTLLLQTLEQMKLDLAGFSVAFSAQRHQGSDRVYLTEIKDGQATPVAR